MFNRVWRSKKSSLYWDFILGLLLHDLSWVIFLPFKNFDDLLNFSKVFLSLLSLVLEFILGNNFAVEAWYELYGGFWGPDLSFGFFHLIFTQLGHNETQCLGWLLSWISWIIEFKSPNLDRLIVTTILCDSHGLSQLPTP